LSTVRTRLVTPRAETLQDIIHPETTGAARRREFPHHLRSALFLRSSKTLRLRVTVLVNGRILIVGTPSARLLNHNGLDCFGGQASSASIGFASAKSPHIKTAYTLEPWQL